MPLLTIDSQNADTGWLDASWLTSDVGFNIAGTWVGTIALDVSHDPAATSKFYSTVASYTANQPPLGLPRHIGSYFRFRRVAWTSGAAKIGVSNGINSDGAVLPLSVQTQTFGTNGAP